MAVKTGCRALREQDEYHCAFCGYRWAVDDEPPPCKTIQERMKPQEPYSSSRYDKARPGKRYKFRQRNTRVG